MKLHAPRNIPGSLALRVVPYCRNTPSIREEYPRRGTATAAMASPAPEKTWKAMPAALEFDLESKCSVRFFNFLLRLQASSFTIALGTWQNTFIPLTVSCVQSIDDQSSS